MAKVLSSEARTRRTKRLIVTIVPLAVGLGVVLVFGFDHGWGFVLNLAVFSVTYVALWFGLNWVLHAHLGWWRSQ